LAALFGDRADAHKALNSLPEAAILPSPPACHDFRCSYLMVVLEIGYLAFPNQ
jgi:hypothetical protein